MLDLSSTILQIDKADTKLDPDSYTNITWDEIKFQLVNAVKKNNESLLWQRSFLHIHGIPSWRCPKICITIFISSFFFGFVKIISPSPGNGSKCCIGNI